MVFALIDLIFSGIVSVHMATGLSTNIRWWLLNNIFQSLINYCFVITLCITNWLIVWREYFLWFGWYAGREILIVFLILSSWTMFAVKIFHSNFKSLNFLLEIETLSWHQIIDGCQWLSLNFHTAFARMGWCGCLIVLHLNIFI